MSGVRAGGLLRAREFTMKDAYSFHADAASLADTFEAMSGAYARLLSTLGVPWRAVEAGSGTIGGAVSREFMLLSGIGEDTVLTSADGVAVNVERAVSLPDSAPGAGAREEAWAVTDVRGWGGGGPGRRGRPCGCGDSAVDGCGRRAPGCERGRHGGCAGGACGRADRA